MNDSYWHGPLLELVQPVKATGCNHCWYSPFTGGPHQKVWVGTKKEDHVVTVEFILETKYVCHIAMSWCLERVILEFKPNFMKSTEHYSTLEVISTTLFISITFMGLAIHQETFPYISDIQTKCGKYLEIFC